MAAISGYTPSSSPPHGGADSSAFPAMSPLTTEATKAAPRRNGAANVGANAMGSPSGNPASGSMARNEQSVADPGNLAVKIVLDPDIKVFVTKYSLVKGAVNFQVPSRHMVENYQRANARPDAAAMAGDRGADRPEGAGPPATTESDQGRANPVGTDQPAAGALARTSRSGGTGDAARGDTGSDGATSKTSRQTAVYA